MTYDVALGIFVLYGVVVALLNYRYFKLRREFEGLTERVQKFGRIHAENMMLRELLTQLGVILKEEVTDSGVTWTALVPPEARKIPSA